MNPTVIGRSMFALGYFILISIFSWQALARDLAVFAIQKNLQLSPKDPVFHDYYLDGGTESGLRAGQLVTVVRRIPMHDLTRNRPLGDMHLPIAQLKIIYVQRGSSVARLHKIIDAKERPLVDFDAVMVGDQVSEGVGDSGGDAASESSSAKEPDVQPLKEKENTVEKADSSSLAPPAATQKSEPSQPKAESSPAAGPKT